MHEQARYLLQRQTVSPPVDAIYQTWHNSAPHLDSSGCKHLLCLHKEADAFFRVKNKPTSVASRALSGNISPSLHHRADAVLNEVFWGISIERGCFEDSLRHCAGNLCGNSQMRIASTFCRLITVVYGAYSFGDSRLQPFLW